MSGEKVATPEAAKTDAETEGVLGRLSGLAWQALPALGSAIGFAGFVAVIGSAIEWIRFDAAKLPATQAVLAVPRAELVFVGALALAAFVGGGALAVLIVYLIDNGGNATAATVHGIVIVGLVEMMVTVTFINAGPWWTYLWLYAWLLVLGLVAADLSGEVVHSFRARTKLKRARVTVVEARDKLIAARAHLATAVRIVEKKSSRKAIEAEEQARLTSVAAQREWEQAIREWVAATKGIEGLPQPKAKDVKEAVEVVNGYNDSPPTGAALERELAKAEEGTGHLVRAVTACLRAQLAHIRALVRIWTELSLKASKALEGLRAAATWAERLDAGKRRDARERARKAAQASQRPTSDLPPTAPRSAVSDADSTVNHAPAALTALVVAVITAAIVTGIVFIVVEDLLSWLAIVFVVVVALTAMNVFVAQVTEKFAWYGIGVFFSVLTFGATLTMARTLDRPKVQPIALVRKGDDVGVCGVYIAQTSERVYVGRPETSSRPGLIFWIPTSDVDLIDVGQPERTGKKFDALAVAMLKRVYQDRAEAASPTLKNTTVVEESVNPRTGVKTTRTREELPKSIAGTAQAAGGSPANSGYPQESPGKTCTDPSIPEARSRGGIRSQ
jgi:hypothetical protein